MSPVENGSQGWKNEKNWRGRHRNIITYYSIPSPNAEPFKLWLAKVGYERIQETTDPERSINRARTNWQRMGDSSKWIQQRMMGQEIRNKLTDYWKDNEVKNQDEYAILTNLIHKNEVI